MKIAFFSVNLAAPWGGSEILWWRTAQYLKAQGHEVEVGIIDHGTWPEPLNRLQEQGIAVHPFQMREEREEFPLWKKLYNRGVPAEKRFVPQLKEKCSLEWLGRFRPDWGVITLGAHNRTAGIAEAFQRYGIPFVLNPQLVRRGLWLAEEKQERQRFCDAYAKAQRTYFVSRENRWLTEQELGFRLPNAEQVWNPYQMERGPALPYPSRGPNWRLACPASLMVLHKGQDVLLEVMADSKWRQRPLSLHLYGKGPDERALKKLVEDFYALENVYLEGYQADVEALWRNAHALVMASHFEGTPLALIEAVLCGRTAITSDVGGNREVIEDNATGFLAKAPTPELMDEALERAWQRRHDWQNIGQKAKAALEGLIPQDPVADYAARLLNLSQEIGPK